MVRLLSVLFTLCLPTICTAEGYWFPLHASDLAPGERYATFTHAIGIQTRGRDIHMRRHVDGDIWVDTVSSNNLPTDAPPLRSPFDRLEANEQSLIFGHPFYAIADGEVIGCWRLAPENPVPGETHENFSGPGDRLIIPGGNHLWVRQDDGVIVLYAHAQPNTIPREICPDKPLEFTPAAVRNGVRGQPDVSEDAYVPEGVAPTIASGTMFQGQQVERPRVVAGQFLGRVGNTGASGGPHLHIHGELVDNNFTSLRAAHLTYDFGAFTLTRNWQASIEFWTTFEDNTLPKGNILIWPPARNPLEYTRHGVPLNQWPRLHDWLRASGMMPVALDRYQVGGSTFVNMSWEPDNGRDWRAELGIGSSAFQRAMDSIDSTSGDRLPFRPTLVESCRGPDSEILYGYAAVRDASGITWSVRHQLSPSAHGDHFAQMQALGLAPVTLSVVSVDNNRSFTSLYDDSRSGLWSEHSRLVRFGSIDQYQELFESEVDAGRIPIHINAYRHNNRDTYSAIFAEAQPAGLISRHVLGGEGFQSQFEDSLQQGLRTRTLTAIDGAAAHVFGGVWSTP